MLTKDQILGADDLPTKMVHIPEWDGNVNLKSLNGYEREELERLITEFKTKGKCSGGQAVRAVSAALSIVDENGNRVFSDDDIPSLAQKSGSALDRILDEVLSHNGMTQRDAEELKKN